MINNRLKSKIKYGYKLELQTPETMKLFDSTKKINRNKKRRRWISFCYDGTYYCFTDSTYGFFIDPTRHTTSRELPPYGCILFETFQIIIGPK